MVFALPVNVRIKEIKQAGVSIPYPELIQLQNKEVQGKINRLIIKKVKALIDEQYKQQAANHFTEMIGSFEIKTNERNLFSVSFGNYAYAEGFAHGLSLMDSLTVDVQTGRVYALKDLFKGNSDYVKVLSKQVKMQIKERELPILNHFTSIDRDQSYYIADKSLVIYFQAYEITPGYVGIPSFPINAFLLEHILLSDGPLGRMLPSL